MHFDSETCTCTDNDQGGHACGQGKTLTCVWQFMGKNTIMCFHLKKGLTEALMLWAQGLLILHGL